MKTVKQMWTTVEKFEGICLKITISVTGLTWCYRVLNPGLFVYGPFLLLKYQAIYTDDPSSHLLLKQISSFHCYRSYI